MPRSRHRTWGTCCCMRHRQTHEYPSRDTFREVAFSECFAIPGMSPDRHCSEQASAPALHRQAACPSVQHKVENGSAGVWRSLQPLGWCLQARPGCPLESSVPAGAVEAGRVHRAVRFTKSVSRSHWRSLFRLAVVVLCLERRFGAATESERQLGDDPPKSRPVLAAVRPGVLPRETP